MKKDADVLLGVAVVIMTGPSRSKEPACADGSFPGPAVNPIALVCHGIVDSRLSYCHVSWISIPPNPARSAAVFE